MNARPDTPTQPIRRVLQVHASGRIAGSSSRALSDHLVAALRQQAAIQLTTRDLADGIEHVGEAWIDANTTAPEQRDAVQREALAASDRLVAELTAADIVVIGVPIYNFGIPAALKAWIDMIARARLTFRYTDNGPQGLLTGKKAYLVVTSGGVVVDSETDFATPYMRQALRFIGITDVEVINAERNNFRGDAADADARRDIQARLTTSHLPLATESVA